MMTRLKRHTQTDNIVEVILNVTKIKKVEEQSDSYLIEEIPVERFKKDLIFFSQSGIFKDAIGWKCVTDGEIIMLSSNICPSVGTELRVYMEASEQAVQVLNESIFDKLAKRLENKNNIQR